MTGSVQDTPQTAIRQERPPGSPWPISVDRLVKDYGARRAVAELSFNVPWGRITGFLGPNGAGKTTTLRILLGLAKPTSGSAVVLGRRYQELKRPGRAVGALIETQQFHPGRRARDHLAILARASGIDHRRVDEVLELVELGGEGRTKVGHYSLGMRQRLGLAAALLGDPRVLVLDEPANGLDPSGIRWLRHLLKEFAERGGSVLVSSHILAEISQIADEVVVIHRGRLVTHTDVDGLITRPASVRLRTPEPERFRNRLLEEGIDATFIGRQELRVTNASAEQVGMVAVREALPIFEMQNEKESLEEAFFDLTEAAEGGSR
jgi:ABC-2 type transport system ATP-binding protein